MGQKVHPNALRLGIVKKHNVVWFETGKKFSETLRSDVEIRSFILKTLPKNSSVSKILIERTGNNIKIVIRTAKPGIIIGAKGKDVDGLKQALTKKLGLKVSINIDEVRKPEIEAKLVAESVASQLERRVLFRKAMKRAISSAMRQGAKGIKIAVSGRVGGAEIARTEWYKEGRVPLHTFRADIDYANALAKTTYGIIGVKVWIFKGEVIGKDSVVSVNDFEEKKTKPRKRFTKKSEPVLKKNSKA